MAYQLGDVFIGTFPQTQAFGARPDVYSARYGLKGHNGVDFGCPSLTLIVAAWDGLITEIGFDEGGYGNYLKITHDGYLTLYGHLNDITVQKGDKVVRGQLIAHSNNTGFSDGPHLHFGVAPCDGNGNKTDPQNGYSGYIDPLGSLCEWHIQNLKAPVQQQTEVAPPVSISPDELSIKTVQANNFLTIVNYGMQNGLGVYLTNNSLSLDLINNPADVDGGKKVNMFIADLIDQIRKLKEAQPAPETAPTPEETVAAVDALPQDKKAGLLSRLLAGVKGFIFQ